MTARPSLVRQTLLAVLGVVALLVQSALPATAMAAPTRTVEICTEHGLKKVVVPADPDDREQSPCPHCENCVAPALAVTPQALVIQSVAYATVVDTAVRPSLKAPPSARAPPRPPGQAPPQS